jgi:hypothetical protein
MNHGINPGVCNGSWIEWNSFRPLKTCVDQFVWDFVNPQIAVRQKIQSATKPSLLFLGRCTTAVFEIEDFFLGNCTTRALRW